MTERVKIINIRKELQSKKEEILELKTLNPFGLKKGENLFSLVFVSTEYPNVNNFSLICKNTELFSEIEQKLNVQFPELKNNDIFFLVNGSLVQKDKTLEENKIKSGNVIELCKIEDV